MNLREWARETHRVLIERPADERLKDSSIAEVENILRTGVFTLINTLLAGGDLTLEELGRFYTIEKQPFTLASNLGDRTKQIAIAKKRIVRFRAAGRLIRNLNKSEN